MRVTRTFFDYYLCHHRFLLMLHCNILYSLRKCLYNVCREECGSAVARKGLRQLKFVSYYMNKIMKVQVQLSTELHR